MTKQHNNSSMKGSSMIDEAVIGACIYSINKRALHCRDMEREAYQLQHWNSFEKYRKCKEELYQQKDELLSYFRPFAIHEDGRNSYYCYNIGGFLFYQPRNRWDAGEGYSVFKIPPLTIHSSNTKALLPQEFCEQILHSLETGTCFIKYRTVN